MIDVQDVINLLFVSILIRNHFQVSRIKESDKLNGFLANTTADKVFGSPQAYIEHVKKISEREVSEQ